MQYFVFAFILSVLSGASGFWFWDSRTTIAPTTAVKINEHDYLSTEPDTKMTTRILDNNALTTSTSLPVVGHSSTQSLHSTTAPPSSQEPTVTSQGTPFIPTVSTVPAKNITFDVDLTQMVGLPFPDHISYVAGTDSYPVLHFGHGASISEPADGLFPTPFPQDFTILATVNPSNRNGGFLFSIMDMFEQYIYLGLALSPEESGQQRVIFFYDALEVTSFPVPVATGQWLRFAIRVGRSWISFLDCQSTLQTPFSGATEPLNLPKGAVLHLAKSAKKNSNFEGSIQELRISKSPVSPGMLCDEEDELDEVSSA